MNEVISKTEAKRYRNVKNHWSDCIPLEINNVDELRRIFPKQTLSTYVNSDQGTHC